MMSVLIIGILSLFGGVALAQSEQVTLPSAGITPESPFYFLDRLGENLREFFTFNSVAKAKLQIKFAGERIAEINVMVEKKGPKAKGIDKAKLLLVANVAHAAEIIKEEKASGKDITKLAKDIDNQFDEQEKLLTKSFQDARKKLKEDRLALIQSLVDQAGDATLVASLKQQIEDLKDQDKELKDEKNSIKKSLHEEKKKIEDELDDEDKNIDEQEQIKEDEQEEADEAEIEDEDKEEIEKAEEKEKPELEEADKENRESGEKVENNGKNNQKIDENDVKTNESENNGTQRDGSLPTP